MAIEGFAPAKINLTLHVTGRRADGYHLLDSLVAFADLGDRLTFEPGPDLSISVSGEHAEGVPTDARNLVWQAAQAMNWRGRVHLDKVLPHGGGIGGGSSDAAATLRALSPEGAEIPLDTALPLGADVPVCTLGRAARMQGVGDRISPVALPSLPALLVNPGVPVPTGPVFKALAARDNPAMPPDLPAFDGPEHCADWLHGQRNDLQPAAIGLAPEIADVLDALSGTRDVLLARMSGSGSTCFALYPTMKAAHFAAYEIGVAQADWWCRAVTLS
ncbi:4-diphosphocytidyl-2-C-methyl-D-erythritol kinase [Ruegeria intermedia]|uniref:4-diphosphocytidyl-2-C-methyl-D-erythritol kinase n=1 Tax=Ruegeria intermedia TaxID=996115 RepID=A0A1M5AFL7_9RHOB|nr:4-(cytidine 5'-diphospho)-2-C-methyl-D-erythritol kinase [Ruegeria intermedia]SHF29100.1 4-diphosphocytidyl-2-C-methyl-D-erythritol kinase [Ruegeria intermedia]